MYYNPNWRLLLKRRSDSDKNSEKGKKKKEWRKKGRKGGGGERKGVEGGKEKRFREVISGYFCHLRTCNDYLEEVLLSIATENAGGLPGGGAGSQESSSPGLIWSRSGAI